LTGVYVDEARRLQNASCKGEGCVYYFSQQNSRGVDVKTKKKIKGVVIVRRGETTLTDAAQGAYRMRYVDTTLADVEGSERVHSFDFLVIGEGKWSVDELTKNELGLAESRKELGQKQKSAFDARVEAFREGRPMDYEQTLGDAEIDAMLLASSGVGLLSTSTSTSRSTSTVMASDVVGEGAIESTWYPRLTENYGPNYSLNFLVGSETKDLTWVRFISGLKTDRGQMIDFQKAMSQLMKAKMRPAATTIMDMIARIVHKALQSDGTTDMFLALAGQLITMGTGADGEPKSKSDVPSYQTHESPCAALLDSNSAGINMRRVLHLAQNGAVFTGEAAYASSGDATGVLIPAEPPATALLYTIMSSAQSEELSKAIKAFEDLFGCALRITPRMFLEHTRIESASCIVIAYEKDGKRVYVLATCADLLLKEIRDVKPLVYFHASRTVTCKTIDLEAIDQEPPQEVLYLLASVGAALSTAHQEKVGQNVAVLDKQQENGTGGCLIALAYRNKRSATRPNKEINPGMGLGTLKESAVRNVKVGTRLVELSEFGRHRKKARYV
jgi:hypothetical protein